MAPSLTILFDADCGICTHTARLLTRLDSGRRLSLVALQEAKIPGQPSLEVLSSALHVVDAQGRWTVGGAATLKIAHEVGALRWLTPLARLPYATRVLDAVYRTIANNRQQISRMLGLRACKVTKRPSSRLP